MSHIFRKKPKAPEVTGKIEYMIVCLGNPGSKYEKTRHNAGFLSADVLWNKYGSGRLNQTKCKAIYGLCVIADKNVAIVKPQTFMNLSGEATRDLAVEDVTVETPITTTTCQMLAGKKLAVLDVGAFVVGCHVATVCHGG